MRVSCDPTDQGFSPAWPTFVFTLNGKPMPHAVTADEELGLLRVVTGEDLLGRPLEQVLFGRVKIERLH